MDADQLVSQKPANLDLHRSQNKIRVQQDKSFKSHMLQYNLCKMAILKKTENWFSRPIIA